MEHSCRALLLVHPFFERVQFSLAQLVFLFRVYVKVLREFAPALGETPLYELKFFGIQSLQSRLDFLHATHRLTITQPRATEASIVVIVLSFLRAEEGGACGSGHRVIGPLDRPPDHFVEEQVVGRIFFREIHFAGDFASPG